MYPRDTEMPSIAVSHAYQENPPGSKLHHFGESNEQDYQEPGVLPEERRWPNSSRIRRDAVPHHRGVHRRDHHPRLKRQRNVQLCWLEHFGLKEPLWPISKVKSFDPLAANPNAASITSFAAEPAAIEPLDSIVSHTYRIRKIALEALLDLVLCQ